MQFVFDNLLALVVGTVIVGILTTVGQRRQEESVVIAEHYMATGRAAALSNWLQSDLQSATAFTSATDSTLVFSRSSDPAALMTVQVEYRRVRVAGTPVRYQIRRREAGNEITIGPTVTGWTATLLSAADQPTAVASSAKSVRIRVVTAKGFTQARAAPVPATVWQRTFTPRLLGTTTV